MDYLLYKRMKFEEYDEILGGVDTSFNMVMSDIRSQDVFPDY